jgi:hypothetical protein
MTRKVRSLVTQKRQEHQQKQDYDDKLFGDRIGQVKTKLRRLQFFLQYSLLCIGTQLLLLSQLGLFRGGIAL